MYKFIQAYYHKSNICVTCKIVTMKGRQFACLLLIFVLVVVPMFILKRLRKQEDINMKDYFSFTGDIRIDNYLKPPVYKTLSAYEKTISVSQFGQDLIVYNVTGKENGFFIELGAFDGKTFSNTFWLENQHNWTGLLIEANPDLCNTIDFMHRHVWRLCACISTNDTEKYIMGGALGGIQSNLHPSISSRYGQNTIQVPCFDLILVLENIGVRHIDYFSLDVEGAELDILESLKKSLRMKLLSVAVWTIEFRIYDGRKNIDSASKVKLNKIRDFFNLIGGYFEYTVIPESPIDYQALDVMYISKHFWCRQNVRLPDNSKCI